MFYYSIKGACFINILSLLVAPRCWKLSGVTFRCLGSKDSGFGTKCAKYESNNTAIRGSTKS